MNLPQKILIANRGEIARRIQTSCRILGIKTVSVFSQEDRELPFVREADEAYLLKGDTTTETYLNSDALVKIALKTGCQGIHPGYGFLSEDADFAEKVEKAGITFVGPSSETIRIMGDKIEARKKMVELKVPLLPGYDGDCSNQEVFLKKAIEIGFPVLLKASSGGGGRAMKVVHDQKDFINDLKSIQSESQKLFGNSHVYIEKYLASSKHLEVQVISDKHGNHLHLFERDCSSQRRNQKVIEEAPAPILSQKNKDKIYKIATHITHKMNYLGAGTIEFIQDSKNPDNIYFLEMNTRIQVEHVVSEIITQVDLVSWQIQVAFGAALPFSQSELKAKGHAIELRIYAEDPEQQFFPSSGVLNKCEFIDLAQSRWDASYESGNTISLLYDPMIGKLVVWDENREKAIERLKQALFNLKISGVKNNCLYLLELIDAQEFKDGSTTTSFIENNPIKKELCFDKLDEAKQASMIAAHLLKDSVTQHEQNINTKDSIIDLWQSESLNSFRLNP